MPAPPIRLHPENPSYYLFRGKPAVLITAAEHYGAVLNGAFNYLRYLDTLQRDGMNLTRVFSGVYREVQSDFGIARNTLAPETDEFIAPWERGNAPGALDGRNRFDLDRWNAVYFDRLRDFAGQASRREIVVELTLFCTYYQDRMWRLSPLHAENNINGLEPVANDAVLVLKNPKRLDVMLRFTRKLAEELRDFDNVIFEICNEPYFAGVELAWQKRIAETLAAEVSSVPRHLIAQNIANNTQAVRDPFPEVSILNFHYARPPAAVADNEALGRVIGYDETGFDGTLDEVYRIQAWDFILAGGGHFNHLDYSFAVGAEDGSFAFPGTQPGGGGRALRGQLRGLSQFIHSFDFVRMKPDSAVIRAGVPAEASARVLAEPGKGYAIYLHHGKLLDGYTPRYIVQTKKQSCALDVDLAAGAYKVEWWTPSLGRVDRVEFLTHPGGMAKLASPEYREDIAIAIRAAS